MALKGFQSATNPPPLDLSPDSPHLSYNREVERELLAWAEAPHSLARRDIEYFLAVVDEGLAYETRPPAAPPRPRSAGNGSIKSNASLKATTHSYGERVRNG